MPQIKNFTDSDVPDQKGRTIVITGSNTGLGFEAAKVLAVKGARVLMACRSEEKAAAAMATIRADNPSANLQFVPLDLGDLESVYIAADLIKQEARLDALINNAGIMLPPKELTKDGFESQFGVNHLGPFALTGLLIDKLEETKKSRIIITSSNAHKQGRINFDDIHADERYSASGRYAMSKLANLLHMYELDRRLQGKKSKTIALACHPGAAATDLPRHLPMVARVLVPAIEPLINSAAQGAWPTLAAACAPDVAGGMYFEPGQKFSWAGPARSGGRTTSAARDPGLAARLWSVSVKLTGVDPGI